MNKRTHNIAVTANVELISSCNICGTSGYRVNEQDPNPATRYAPSGVRLFKLTYSPNGFQSYSTLVCPKCAHELRNALAPVADLLGQEGA